MFSLVFMRSPCICSCFLLCTFTSCLLWLCLRASHCRTPKRPGLNERGLADECRYCGSEMNADSQFSVPGTASFECCHCRSKRVTVPANVISRVIGRGGSNINSIRDASGAHVDIEKSQKGAVDRVITIK